MSRAIHLISYFLAGCIASTLISWSGGLHPVLLRFAVALYLLAGVCWTAFLIFDDALLKRFEMTLLEYRAVLVGTMAAVAIGIGVGVVVCLQNI